MEYLGTRVAAPYPWLPPPPPPPLCSLQMSVSVSSGSASRGLSKSLTPLPALLDKARQLHADGALVACRLAGVMQVGRKA